MNRHINWKRVLIFFIIATVISNIFRLNIFDHKSQLEQLPNWFFVLTIALLEGSGIIIGALIAIKLLKKKRKTVMSLFGTSKSKSLMMLSIPIITLTVIGVKNEFNLDSHLYGLVAIIGTLLYCIMEEYGWRGYLQEELKTLKSWQRYLIIGFLWYLWHLNFITDLSIKNNLFFLSVMIFGSWGIGQVAEATKSIIASACFHLIAQIMMYNSLIRNGINNTEKLIIIGISVIVWIAITKKWEKENTTLLT